MTREDAKKIIGEDATDIQITNFLNYHHSEEKIRNDEINSLKTQIDGYKDYNDIKKELDDVRKANMTNEELLAAKQKELDDALAKTKEEEAKLLKKQNSLEAKSILIEAGITDEEQLKGLLSSISTDNKDLTIASAKNIADLVKATKDSTEKSVKESLMKHEPDPSNDGKKVKDDGQMTKEKFDKLTFAEQKEWKDKNGVEAYHNLINS